MSEQPRSLRLAYHYLGCARVTDDGVATSSFHGALIEAFADRVRSVDIVAYDPPADGGSLEDAADYLVSPARANVNFVSLGPKGSWRDMWRRRRSITNVVRRASGDWDVLLYKLPNRRISAVHRANRCAQVVTIDGSGLLAAARAMRGSLRRKLVKQAVAAMADRRARRVVRDSGLVFVNSGLLARRHRPINEEVELVVWSLRRAAYSYRTDDRLVDPQPNIAFVGRVSPPKGVFDAVDAFVSLKTSTLPAARLHIIGDGEAIADVRERVHEAGFADDVEFHGWLPTGGPLYSVLSRMDVLLHLSFAESFPRIVWEAMAHSVLVVCTPVGGLTDALVDERDLLYVPVRDPRAAADAIGRLHSDPALRRRLIASAYERARETDVERVVEHMLNRIGSRWPALGAER